MPQQNTSLKTPETKARTEHTKRLFYMVWAVIGIVLLIIGAGWALGKITTVLAIIALTAFIVFILRVPVAWLERHGVNRLLGSLISYLGAILIVTAILLIFIPIIWQQVLGLINMIPSYVNDATNAFNNLYQQYSYLLEDSNIQKIVGGAATNLSDWATQIVSQSTKGVVTLGVNIVSAMLVFLVSLIAGFWILKDLPKIGREFRIIIGPRFEEDTLFIVNTCARSFGGYLRGMTVAGACTGIIAGIGYYFLGLPYPAVLGLLVGILNFIPYVGPWTAGAVVAIIGIFISPVIALISIIITIFAEQFTDNLILPRLMSSTVDLHPAIVLIGIFAGGALGGPIGLIAAIPLLSAIKSIFVYFFEKRTKRELADEKGALFKVSSAKGKGALFKARRAQDAKDAASTTEVPLTTKMVKAVTPKVFKTSDASTPKDALGQPGGAKDNPDDQKENREKQ